MAAIVLLVLTGLTIATLKVEEKKAQIEAQKETIKELTDELHTYQVMYLKCQGNIEAEKYGAHYVDGKLKFYRIK